jgi:hypothetical protein
MTYAEQFPKPEGDIPPEPPEEPATPAGREPASLTAYQAAKRSWRALAIARDEWILAFRKHGVAVAVDKLIKQEERSPGERIAMIMGMTWLENRLSPHEDVFTALFGGL